MKSLKWVTIITFSFSVFSLIALVYFFYAGASYSLGYDISLALFGSAVLGCIMSMVQYFSEKRKSMEDFYLESLNVINAIAALEYFDYLYDKDKMLLCFLEEWHNNSAYSNDSDNDNTVAKKEIIMEIRKGYGKYELSDEEAEQAYQDKIKRVERNIINGMEKYLCFSKTNLRPLDDAFGKLDFIIYNKATRSMVYDNIYSKIRNAVGIVREKAYHFEEYFKVDDGNKPIMMKLLLELNDVFFVQDTEEKEKSIVVSIYRRTYDKLSYDLELFRCKIYKQKNKPLESIAIKTHQRNL